MQRYQLLLPDDIIKTAQRLAAERMISVAAVLRIWVVEGAKNDGISIQKAVSLAAPTKTVNTLPVQSFAPPNPSWRPPGALQSIYGKKEGE